MEILVVGAGAIGGYFGARLLAANRHVTFLVRKERLSGILSTGLHISSPHGDLHVIPRAISADEIRGAFDLVLLCIPSFGLEKSIRDLAPAVGPDTVLLPLLNGMRHMRILEDRFGRSPLIGGVCLIAVETGADGEIRQLSPVHEMIYGEIDDARTPRIEAVHAALSNAGFETQISQNIQQAMWEKWVFIASLGASTCLLQGTVGEINATPGGAETLLRILDECRAVAAAEGHEPSASFQSQQRARVTAQGSPATASLYRNSRQGRQIEADSILGDLLEIGKKHGIDTPLLRAAYCGLCVYQNRLNKNSAVS